MYWTVKWIKQKMIQLKYVAKMYKHISADKMGNAIDDSLENG